MATAEKSVEIGLVLQGGGALGAYEFGAVIALLELMDAIEKAGRAVRLVAVDRCLDRRDQRGLHRRREGPRRRAAPPARAVGRPDA